MPRCRRGCRGNRLAISLAQRRAQTLGRTIGGRLAARRGRSAGTARSAHRPADSHVAPQRGIRAGQRRRPARATRQPGRAAVGRVGGGSGRSSGTARGVGLAAVDRAKSVCGAAAGRQRHRQDRHGAAQRPARPHDRGAGSAGPRHARQRRGADGRTRLSVAGGSHSAGSRPARFHERHLVAARQRSAAAAGSGARLRFAIAAPVGPAAAKPGSHAEYGRQRQCRRAFSGGHWRADTRPGASAGGGVARATWRALCRTGALGERRRVFCAGGRSLCESTFGRRGAALAGAVSRQRRNGAPRGRRAPDGCCAGAVRRRQLRGPVSTRCPSARAPVVAAAGAAMAPPASADRFTKADFYAKQLELVQPALLAEPDVRFPLAVVQRQLGAARQAERYYQSLRHGRPHDAWWACAQAELWLLETGSKPPKPLWNCARVADKPRLDGQLDEPMWRAAGAIELHSPLRDDAEWPAVAMLACDDEFLYLGLSCTRAEGFQYEPSDAPRPRDADLSRQDRVELYIDVDRDFVSYYRLAVDHRGWTGESVLGRQELGSQLVRGQPLGRSGLDDRGRDSAGRAFRPTAGQGQSLGRGRHADRARRGFSIVEHAGQRRRCARGIRVHDREVGTAGRRRRYRLENCVPLRAPRRP